ncbi:hypothetical protein HK101_003488 [Irineochytrium annulatum]|nr:hypothetical protein HK101_003488 [Irineochytrium annulatum]
MRNNDIDDQVEYMVVHLDNKNRTARVSLGAYEALLKLEAIEKKAILDTGSFESSWKPEYGRYMLEGTPGGPYGSKLEDLLTVEENMRRRRLLVETQMGPNEAVVSVTNFPRLGSDDFLHPPSRPTPDSASGASRSLFIPDEAINPHPRFRTLTANIRKRRGSKVCINVPVYYDSKTLSPFKEPLPRSLLDPSVNFEEAVSQTCSTAKSQTVPLKEGVDRTKLTLPDVVSDAKEDHIYLDCMCFGMGCSCLQVTFQACSVEEARRLYDQLAVMTPIMVDLEVSELMALSAASPIFRGYLADVDCRWDIIAASVDDRTKEERGELPLKNDKFRIPKSRYESISTYLSPGPNYSGGCSGDPADLEVPANFFKPEYNDIPLVYDQSIYKELMENGVDSCLAKHYSHLFIRDPLVIFSELLDVDDKVSSDHFENIQSTNWQTMRFKPPPPSASNIGWRVEFRSMEVQLTDYENAAYSIFVVLLSRTILSFNLNFYIPLSKVDENMRAGVTRDAVLNQKFWFRDNVGSATPLNRPTAQDSDTFSQVLINDIINGNNSFVGLVPLVRNYLTSLSIPHATYTRLDSYLTLISKRASGTLPTAARWIRDLVQNHKNYGHDSVINEAINFDIITQAVELGKRDGPVAGLSG